jgi:multiple antibiotic resistance protein
MNADLLQKFVRDALVLFATIDPIAALVIFASITGKLPAGKRSRIALRSVLYSAAILVGSAVLGQFVLIGMGISLVAFQVAGGIVLFIFAMQMVYGSVQHSFTPEGDPAIYPLAIPTIASPGSILAIILLTDNHLYHVATQAVTVAIAFAILLLTYILFRSATRILKFIGQPGAELLIRIMGLILAALSVQLVMDALLSGTIGH